MMRSKLFALKWLPAKTISSAKDLRQLHLYLCGIKLICFPRNLKPDTGYAKVTQHPFRYDPQRMTDRLQPEPTDKVISSCARILSTCLQFQPMEAICILCKRNLDGSSLEKHVKEVHLIGHEGALNLLLDYLRRETGCQVEEFELVRQN